MWHDKQALNRNDGSKHQPLCSFILLTVVCLMCVCWSFLVRSLALSFPFFGFLDPCINHIIRYGNKTKSHCEADIINGYADNMKSYLSKWNWKLTCQIALRFHCNIAYLINCFSKVFDFGIANSTLRRSNSQSSFVSTSNICKKIYSRKFQSHLSICELKWERNGISIVQLLLWNKWVFLY